MTFTKIHCVSFTFCTIVNRHHVQGFNELYWGLQAEIFIDTYFFLRQNPEDIYIYSILQYNFGS